MLKVVTVFLATQHFPQSHQEVYSALALDAGLKFRLQLLRLLHQAQYFSNVDTHIMPKDIPPLQRLCEGMIFLEFSSPGPKSLVP